jgi:hypothetical protein
MITASETKLCQSCIERGFKPAQPATREYLTGVFYCDDCFNALLENLTNIAPAEMIKETVSKIENTNGNNGNRIPILEAIYQEYHIPAELQFNKVDTVCRNHDKIFHFHSPAIVNKSLEDLEVEQEQLAIALFNIKFRHDVFEKRIKDIKSDLRKEKNLTSYNDSKEIYSTPKKTKSSAIKATQEEKLAKTLGLSLEEYRTMQAEAQGLNKKVQEQKFDDIMNGKSVTTLPTKVSRMR